MEHCAQSILQKRLMVAPPKFLLRVPTEILSNGDTETINVWVIIIIRIICVSDW